MAVPTQATLVANVRNLIGESEADFYSDANIIVWLDDGQNFLAQGLRDEVVPDLQVAFDQNTVIGQELYPLPADFLRGREVELNGVVCRPIAVERLRALAENKFWIPSTTRPFFYEWGGKKIGIRPIPTSAVALKQRYIALPTPSSSGLSPKLPEDVYPAVVFYAAARAKEKEGATTEADRFQALCQAVINLKNGEQKQ